MTEQEELKIKIRNLEKERDKYLAEVKRLSKKEYGLRWIDVPEAFEKDSEDKIPILEEIKDKAICTETNSQPTHLLIEGDNYHALTCLNYTHRGKIDVIYIDPPYNTGNDGFTYKDKRFLTEFPDGTTVPREHPLRHSYWLSFMSKRLELAKNLLSDKGVIFISIDDNEQANLKLLCDKVFGEKNNISNFIIIRSEGGGLAKQAIIGHDYLLAYSKVLGSFTPLKRDKEIRGERIKFNGNDYWIETDWLRKEFGKYGTCLYEDIEIFFDKTKKDEIDDGLQKGYYRLIPKGEKHIVGRLRNIAEDGSKLYTIQKFLNKEGVLALKRLDMEDKFEYPKPVSLIKEMVYSATFFHSDKNAIILDFFAGSGSTGQAVLELNKRDGGTRQYILVQQNEGENRICENVTYERNRRVMCGYTNTKGEDIAGLGGSMKYYRTAFVGKNKPQNVTDEDRIALSQKAGTLLAIGENTLNEVKATNSFQLFSDDNNRFTAVYFTGNLETFSDFVNEISKIQQNRETQIAVYIFCWGSVDSFENEFDNLRGISLKAIPQPIIEIYKSLNQ